MINIDEIMDMLDWHQSDKIQEAGRKLASNIKCINVFVLPCYEGHGKNIWENCALILSEKSDAELKPHINRMFEWLEDMNWPGAFCIRDRLLQFKDRDWMNMVLNRQIQLATGYCNIWLHELERFKREYEIQQEYNVVFEDTE